MAWPKSTHHGRKLGSKDKHYTHHVVRAGHKINSRGTQGRIGSTRKTAKKK